MRKLTLKVSGTDSPIDRLTLGIVAAFFLSLLYWTFRFQSCLPAVTDTFMHLYPDKIYIIGQFRQGLLPLWNPLIGCGVPELANWQSSCFYPLFWVWDLLGSPSAWVALDLFQVLLAFVGFYLWLHSQGTNPLWSVLGALSFSGSALFVRCWAYPYHLAALIWIPWIFWSVDRAFQEQKTGFWFLASFFMALQLLAGYPLFVFYTWVVLTAWFGSRRPSRKTLLFFFFSILCALALSALQWLPFLEFLSQADRGGWWKAFPYYNRPVEFLSLLGPALLRTPGTEGYRGTSANFVFNLYMGWMPLLTLALGWFWVQKKGTSFWFWGIFSLLLLIWTAGPALPPGRLLPEKVLEGLEPSKAVCLFLFCACTFTARAWERGWDGTDKPWKFSVLFFLATLWTLDLLWVPFQITASLPDPYQKGGTAGFARQVRDLAGDGRFLALSPESQLGLSPHLDQAAIQAPVEKVMANTNEVWGIRSASFYLSIWPKSLNNLLRYTSKGFPYPGDLLDIAGVRLFLLPQPLPEPKYRPAGKWGNLFLSLNPSASDQTWWMGQKVDLPDRVSVLERIAQSESQWKRKVYLEKGPGGGDVALEPVGRDLARAPAPGFHRLSAGRVRLGENFPRAGYLAFNETFFPGWHAWLDGNPVPILRAYGLFMAVVVPEGTHQVEFRYEPDTFRLGLFISLLALAFTGMTAALYGFRTV